MNAARFSSLAALLLLLTGLPLLAQDPAPQQLDAATGAKLQELVQEAQQLHSRQRVREALDKLDEAEKLAPNNPVVNNVRGSLYTAIRDFEKARESFVKAEALSPAAFEPKFNLAEINYVEGKYPEAQASFNKLLIDYPKIPVNVRHLTLFKIVVCQLKQGLVDDAKKTMATFTFMDDTPAYYFANAAMIFHHGNKVEGQEWVAKAGKIFKDPENMPYLDTLMEARWLPSLTVPDLK